MGGTGPDRYPDCIAATCDHGTVLAGKATCRCDAGYYGGGAWVSGRSYPLCAPATCAHGDILPGTTICKCDPGYVGGGAHVIGATYPACEPLFDESLAGAYAPSDGVEDAWGGGGSSATPPQLFWSKIRFSGTLASVNAALDGLVYQGATQWNSAAAGGAPDRIRLIADDLGSSGKGGARRAEQSLRVFVRAINDAPSVMVPGITSDGLSVNALYVDEDSKLAVTGVSVGDVDALGTADTIMHLEITLEATHGNVTVTAVQPLATMVFVAGGDDTSCVSPTCVFRATVTDANRILATLHFQPDTNYHGAASLRVGVSDQGHSGAGGALSASRTIPIEVRPVNDAPIVSVPLMADGGKTQTLREGATIEINGAPYYGISARSLIHQQSTGYELWRSEGTRPDVDSADWGNSDFAWRNHLVRDIRPGSQPSSPRHFAVLGQLLYFQADDGVHGAELWRTDGTAAGTTLVKDLLPGGRGAAPRYLTAFKDKLYFQANGIDTTWMLRNPGSSVGWHFHGDEVDECNGFRQSSTNADVRFAVSETSVWDMERVYDCPEGYHWATTAEGMRLFTGTHGAYGPASEAHTYWNECGWKNFKWPAKTTVKNAAGATSQQERELFRFADSATTGAYKHAGRRDSYMPEVSYDSSGKIVHQTAKFAGVVCVRGDSEECRTNEAGCHVRRGSELWSTDGTKRGTQRVTDSIRPGLRGSSPSYLTELKMSCSAVQSSECTDSCTWDVATSTCKTQAGFVCAGKAQGVCKGRCEWYDGSCRDRSHLLFQATSDQAGAELWRTDGTAMGTVQVEDIRRGEFGSNPQFLTAHGDHVYFSADDGHWGTELWRTDGASRSDVSGTSGDRGVSGTSLVLDISKQCSARSEAGCTGECVWNSLAVTPTCEMYALPAALSKRPHSSNPRYLCSSAALGLLFFQADDGAHGAELWKYDGTTATMVKDIYPGAVGSSPSYIVAFNNQVYFQANDGTYGAQLWRSDGTNVNRITDVVVGTADSPRFLTVLDSKLFFTANTAAGGSQMWVTETTGTTKRAFYHTHNEIDIDAAAMDSDYPATLATFRGTLYYAAGTAQQNIYRRPNIVSALGGDGRGGAGAVPDVVGGGGVVVDQGIVIEDVDSVASTQYSVSLAASKGALTLGDVGGLTFSRGDGFADVNVQFTGTLDRVNAAFRGMQYTGRRHATGADAITIEVTDQVVPGGFGVSHTTRSSIDIDIVAVNDAPVITLPTVLPLAASRGMPLLVQGLRVDDTDADDDALTGDTLAGTRYGLIQTTLSATHGRLSLGSTRGLQFSTGSGVGQRHVTVLGNLRDTNLALAALRYECSRTAQPPCNAANDEIGIMVNDQGHSGAGGPQSTSKKLQISVAG